MDGQTTTRETTGGMPREEAMRRAKELLDEARSPAGRATDDKAYGLQLSIVTGPLPSY